MRPERAFPDGALRLKTFDELDRYVHAFSRGVLNLLILVGPPGLQKSHLVRDVLPDACFIEGHATALGIYCRLWEFRDEPVVIDDVDSLYRDRGAVRLLKALCQTDPRKTIAWESDAPALRRVGIPRRFSTSSRVLIIANDWRTLNINVSALEDRGHLVVFEPTAFEVHVRTASWFWDQEVFDFVGEHLHLIESPSMRTYVAAWELKLAELEWRKSILARWVSGARLLAAQLLADPTFDSEEDRARAFTARGGGCRATYFNHARHIRPAEEPPRIVLTSKPPGHEAQGNLMDLLRQRYRGLGNG
jgi:hypothetical protein